MVAEREKHENSEKNKRENEWRKQTKKYLCRCGQYWRSASLGRKLSFPPGFKLPCVPERWWGRFLFNESEDSTVFITIDVYSVYYPSTTVKPMKPPFTISLSNCEENDGIKTDRWTTLLAVTGASLSDRKLATAKAKPAEIFIGATTFPTSWSGDLKKIMMNSKPLRKNKNTSVQIC